MSKGVSPSNTKSEGMTDEKSVGKELRAATRFMKALSHPLRLAMVCGLLESSSTQTEISKTLGVPQSTVAQHLKVLRQARIIKGVRDGSSLSFVVCDNRAQVILSTVCHTLHGSNSSWEDMGHQCNPDDLHA